MAIVDIIRTIRVRCKFHGLTWWKTSSMRLGGGSWHSASRKTILARSQNILIAPVLSHNFIHMYISIYFY